jgi:hypothetical protein
MQDPPPLPSGAMRFHEKRFASKLPSRGQVLLCLLTLPLAILQALSKRLRKVASDAGVPDKRVDVLADEMRMGH